MSQHNDVNIPDISRGDARWLDIIQSEDARRIYSGNLRAEHGLARLEIRDAEKTSPLGSTLGVPITPRRKAWMVRMLQSEESDT
jgi:hypothetical protein